MPPSTDSSTTNATCLEASCSMPWSNYISYRILPIIPIIGSGSEFIYIPQFDQWPHQAASQLLSFLLHISQTHLLSKLIPYNKSQNTNPHDLLTPISEYLNVALSSFVHGGRPFDDYPIERPNYIDGMLMNKWSETKRPSELVKTAEEASYS